MKKMPGTADFVEGSWTIRNKIIEPIFILTIDFHETFYICRKKRGGIMKISMKTLLITVVAALVISFVFVICGYYLLGSGSYPVLSAVVLGIAWLLALWLLFSTVFSKKRKRGLFLLI